MKHTSAALKAAAQRVVALAGYDDTTIDLLPLDAFGEKASTIRVALKKHRHFLASHCSVMIAEAEVLVVDFKLHATGVEMVQGDGFSQKQPVVSPSVLMDIALLAASLSKVFRNVKIGTGQLRLIADMNED